MSMGGLMSLLVGMPKRRAEAHGRARRRLGGSGSHRRVVAEGLENRVHLSTVSYVASPPMPTVAGPWSVRTADLNGDGIQDMVVVAKDASSVQVFLGQSNHTFQSGITYPVLVPRTGTQNSQPRAVAIADIDGDGILDLAVPNFVGQAVNIFRGHGDGTFVPAVPISAGTGPAALHSPMGIVTGDFDGNGSTDIAVTNFSANTITVLPGAGGGAPVAYRVGASPVSIATGDFDGDGVADLATANFGDSTVSILYGKGDGTFAPQQQRVAALRPGAVVAADFNGDGKADLAVTGGSPRVGVLLSNGDARTFGRLARYRVGLGSLGLTAGDLNGDGNADLAVTNYFGRSVSVLLGDGDGTFSGRRNFRVPMTRPRSVAIADFNDDGRLGLAVMGSRTSQYSVLWGNEAPTGINLSPGTVQSPTANAVVGTLTAVDATPDDSVTRFALVTGEGSQNNSLFFVKLTGGQWLLRARRALAAGTYTIRLRVTDAGGESFEQPVEITVT